MSRTQPSAIAWHTRWSAVGGPRHFRDELELPAPARDARCLRAVERPGSAGRHRNPQQERVALSDAHRVGGENADALYRSRPVFPDSRCVGTDSGTAEDTCAAAGGEAGSLPAGREPGAVDA